MKEIRITRDDIVNARREILQESVCNILTILVELTCTMEEGRPGDLIILDMKRWKVIGE